MAIVKLTKGATFQDLKKYCKYRGLSARQLSNGDFSVNVMPHNPRITTENAHTRARALAKYYMEHCGVAVAVVRFELRQHNSRLHVKDFLYKIFLDDLQNGNEFADFLKSLSLFSAYHGKMHRFKGNIPFLDN